MRGIYMFIVSLVLNGAATFLGFLKFEDVNTIYGQNTIVGAVIISAAYAGVLWFVAGVTAGNSAPSFVLCVLAAGAVVLLGWVINGGRGVMIGIVLDGVAPLTLVLGQNWRLWRMRGSLTRAAF